MDLEDGIDGDNYQESRQKTDFVEENCSFIFVSDIRHWGASTRAESLVEFFDVLTVRRKTA